MVAERPCLKAERDHVMFVIPALCPDNEWPILERYATLIRKSPEHAPSLHGA
jgi:hypothetical protein